METRDLKSAVKHVNANGLLLVFPINNKPEPNSLWRCFYSRTKMLWEWSEKGDERVPLIWHLREELSRSRKVVYVKWYQGRATLFSFDLFRAVLSYFLRIPFEERPTLNSDALNILSLLEDDSPLPTKELRALSELSGKHNEARFNKAIKQLSQRLLVVGFGEIEEGGFPSLALGSTKVLFEDLWDEANALTGEEAEKVIEKYLPHGSLLRKYFENNLKKFAKESLREVSPL